MPEFPSSPYDQIDAALVLAGAVVTAVWGIRVRRGRPRDPLRGSPIRASVLSPLWLWLALFTYAVSALAAQSVVSWYHPEGLTDAALARQRTILAGNLSQVIVIVASLWILRQTFVAGWRGAGLGRNCLGSDLLTAGWSFVAAFSLCSMVAWLTEFLARLLEPELDLPVHTVFETLNDRAAPAFVQVVALLGAMILAPVGEELLFRGVFQSGLRYAVPPKPGSLRHRWIAIAVTSIVFGFMHWPLVQHIPALIVLALILGYQYERTGSLVVPIAIHILFNTKSLLWNWLQNGG